MKGDIPHSTSPIAVSISTTVPENHKRSSPRAWRDFAETASTVISIGVVRGLRTLKPRGTKGTTVILPGASDSLGIEAQQ